MLELSVAGIWMEACMVFIIIRPMSAVQLVWSLAEILPLIGVIQRGDTHECMLPKGTSCVQLNAFFPRDGSTETSPFNWG